jgi:hypothetical protein
MLWYTESRMRVSIPEQHRELLEPFLRADDMRAPTYYWVAGLLERGVRTLIYVGEYERVCN